MYIKSKSQIVSGGPYVTVRPMKNLQTNSADQRLPPKSINVPAVLSASHHTYIETQEAANLHVASVPASYPFIMQIYKRAAYLLMFTHQSAVREINTA